MPSLSFMKQFSQGVENGVALCDGKELPFPGVKPKRQTIRAKRKTPFKVDDILFLFVSLRTNQCRRLGKAVCECVRTIWIDEGFIEVEGIELDEADIHELAIADGFNRGSKC